MGNSISNEECNKACDVKIKKEKQSLDNKFEKRLRENSEKLYEYMLEVYENRTTKEEVISEIEHDKENYLNYIKWRILDGSIIVPENETPTDDDKIKYFNAISEATNIKIEEVKNNINKNFNKGLSEDEKKRFRNDWNIAIEKIIPIILTGEFTEDKETISKFFGNVGYNFIQKIFFRERFFNRFKGVTYNPPHDASDASIESFVNNVDEEDNEYEYYNEYYNEGDIKNDNIFLKILFILIIIALFLHLFRD